MTANLDRLDRGLITSFNRPGGNVMSVRRLTTKANSLTVPASLLATADRVIE